MKRKIALLLAVVMILSLVPMMSFAASKNYLSYSAPRVADDYESEDGSPVNTLYLENDNKPTFTDANIKGAAFTLTLPSGVKWNKDIYNAPTSVTGLVYVAVENVTDQTLDLRFTEAKNAEVPLYVNVDGATGPLTVELDPRDSILTGGSYTFATVGEGSTTTTIESVNKVSKGSGQELKTIRIEENSIGSLFVAGATQADRKQKVELRLPTGYSWYKDATTGYGTLTPAGGFSSRVNVIDVDVDSDDERTLIVEFDIHTKPTARGVLYLEDLAINVPRSADEEEVIVEVDGDEVTATDLEVAEVRDWGATVEVKEVKEIVAGKDETSTAYKTAKITIEETLTNSLVTGRDLYMELPDWAQVRDGSNVTVKASNGFGSIAIEEDRNELYVRVNNYSGKRKLEIEIPLSIQADKTGEIELTVWGAGFEEQTIVVAEAIAPIVVTTDSTDIKIGVQSQPAPDITIEENVKGALKAKTVVLELPEGVRFAKTPKIEVVSGNLALKSDSVERSLSNQRVSFDVKSTSTRPATINITDIELTATRYVPEGPIELKVFGDAIVDSDNADQFDVSTFTTIDYANVITPAPGETTRPAVALTIGVVPEGGDVAPYINNNRTFAPVSAVAQALGVAKSNIIWNGEARTVTILGDKTVQMTIGSTTLLVNGTPLVMDVAPEITSDRTFLPIAWLAKALDVNYAWDAATQTVTFQ